MSEWYLAAGARDGAELVLVMVIKLILSRVFFNDHFQWEGCFFNKPLINNQMFDSAQPQNDKMLEFIDIHDLINAVQEYFSLFLSFLLCTLRGNIILMDWSDIRINVDLANVRVFVVYWLQF